MGRSHEGVGREQGKERDSGMSEEVAEAGDALPFACIPSPAEGREYSVGTRVDGCSGLGPGRRAAPGCCGLAEGSGLTPSEPLLLPQVTGWRFPFASAPGWAAGAPFCPSCQGLAQARTLCSVTLTPAAGAGCILCSSSAWWLRGGALWGHGAHRQPTPWSLTEHLVLLPDL